MSKAKLALWMWAIWLMDHRLIQFLIGAVIIASLSLWGSK